MLGSAVYPDSFRVSTAHFDGFDQAILPHCYHKTAFFCIPAGATADFTGAIPHFATPTHSRVSAGVTRSKLVFFSTNHSKTPRAFHQSHSMHTSPTVDDIPSALLCLPKTASSAIQYLICSERSIPYSWSIFRPDAVQLFGPRTFC